MEETIQRSVIINNVEVPTIEEGGMIYYPISYIMKNVLLKQTTSTNIKNSFENHNINYIKEYEVDYGLYSGGTQNVKCISEEGLKEILKNSKLGSLSVEQRKAMNKLLKYLHMDLVNTGEQFIEQMNNKYIKQYNEFIQDCINDVMIENPNIVWQRCSKCNKYYPYHINFFSKNIHSSAELNTYCKDCTQGHHIKMSNKRLENIYYEYGNEVYLLYKNIDVIGIYNHYINNNIRFLPKEINNKESLLTIIKRLYSDGKINKFNLCTNLLEEDLKIKNLFHILKIDEIYYELFGNDYRQRPWDYPNYKLKDLTHNEAKDIFNNYMLEKNIIIEDIYNVDYPIILHECGLGYYINGDYLGFIMEYFNNQYAPYKFKTRGINYWKSKENVNDAMRYFIEDDMKIPIEKIPLYVTLNNLQKNARTLYNLIYEKRFHKCLYDWINEIYPNRFHELDFSMMSIRNKFDSNEEEIIYDELKIRFKNVIYNKRNTDNTVSFKNMIPDYLVFTDNGFYIVEYFGLYVPSKVENSKRLSDYVKKTDLKINTYRTINHKKIYLYPEDLENDMEGFKEKIKNIV